MARPKAQVKEDVKNKIYILKNNWRPLTYTLSNRHKPELPLQYFDEKNKTLKSLRYATNQESVFISEQTGEATLGSVVFEKGVLVVPHTNPTLQMFLDLHPKNGLLFEEFNPEKEAEKELEVLSGNDTNHNKCRKSIMESEQRIGYPLIDCLKDIQNPDNIVPSWTNGGEDTRSYKNRAEFNKIFDNKCKN